MNSNNPLKQYFRQSSIYVRLPSGGKFYPTGTIEIPENSEFPVYPMTAVDEITYRTPDALYNGQAVVSVVESCVPAIKKAWEMPVVDLDSLLVAIRIASNGHEMPFEATCPKCSNVDSHVLDLRVVLDNLKAADYTIPIEHSDLKIYFKPMTYKNMSENNKSQYAAQRMLQQLPSQTDDAIADRAAKYNEVLKMITDITINALAQSIAVIVTPTARVTEYEYILELLNNCDKRVFAQIRDYVIAAKESAEMQPLDLTCSSCKHEFKQAVTLNMSDFFGAAS